MGGLTAALAIFVALLAGLVIGWLLGGRGAADARAERDARAEEFKRAIVDLAGAEERARGADALRDELVTMREDRDLARLENIELRTHASGFETRLTELREAKDVMTAHFAELSTKALGAAQETFLKRADERFRQSEETAGHNLKSMLQPVSDRLLKYEEAVTKVETERKGAFSELKGQIEQMRVGQEKVSSEAAKLVNSLRNAPKSRGRWGEQQLKNVLETCGLSEHTDFETEVSVSGGDEGGRLRPDATIRIPDGRILVIDAKVSLNAYQDAFGAVDEAERRTGLAAHAASMKAHVTALGNKAYWSQFADAPDYVIMFVPGEHFLSAALEHDHDLWNFAFEKKVLLATPTNLIAIARTVSAVWRQERLAKEARQIGELGKELYDRLAKAAGDLKKVGGGLTSAVNNYNAFVSSFESRTLVTARKLRDLNIEPGAREIEDVPPVEALARYGEGPRLIEDVGEAAE
ncbi:MAG: DNA recombination protein RmuC [Pseudomonadota bacterium]|nr:DNA recombination protein RmuC [Pseudomonadota bacterium]